MQCTILRVAGTLFDRFGADNVSLDEIAVTVGITAPYLQTYFSSADEIRSRVATDSGIGLAA
jgi:AcrR family transcriptional regulator